jgi:(p)ppGpp synthase/HD superfamily hydrolase
MNSKILAFAIEAHSKVNHLYDGKPYSVHLAMVSDIAYRFFDVALNEQLLNYDFKENLHNVEVLKNNILHICWLHDTIEDCRVTYNDLRMIVSIEIADAVYALSNEKGKNRNERANQKYFQDIRNNRIALFVKLCDRIANVTYSKENSSNMYEVYKSENKKFIESLFTPLGTTEQERTVYFPITNHLEKLFKL